MTEPLRVGSRSNEFEGWADEDAVAAFALATNDPNDRYLRGEAAPPLFTAGLIMPALWESQEGSGERESVTGASTSVHGEHDVIFAGVIKPGSALRWQASTFGCRQLPGGVLITHRIVVSGADGAPLVEHLWTNFHVRGVIGGDLGEQPADHTFPEDARSRPAGTRTIAVDRDQTYRYGGVSGDRIGHALDDEIARSEGYPRKILQGMCTFGICSGAMVDLGAGGDIARLRRFAGRFSAPAFPGRDLAVHAFDAGTTPNGLQVLAFEAIQDGVTVIKHGRAEFTPR
jgi:acyl dehydratase